MPSNQDRTGHTVADAGISPGTNVSPQSSETNSSQIIRDAVTLPDEAVQLSKPVVEAAVERQAPAVDAASSQTEPVQHTAEPGEKSCSLETQLSQQTEGTPTHAAKSADRQDEPTVDPRTESENQHVVDKPVSDVDKEPSPHQPVDHRESHVESVDSSSDSSVDRPSQETDTTAQHDQHSSANDAEQSQPATKSDSLDALDDDDGDEQHLSDEHKDEQGEQPSTPRITEPASDRDDSQHHIVNTDKVLDEPSDSANRLPPSDNINMQLNRADSEDVAAATSDEQLTTDGDKGSVDSYLAPVVNLLAALDAWLMTCIDTVSGKCMLIFLPLFFKSWLCLVGTYQMIGHVSSGFKEFIYRFTILQFHFHDYFLVQLLLKFLSVAKRQLKTFLFTKSFPSVYVFFL